MMPNAPMAERNHRAKYALAVDENDMIVSSDSFNATDLEYMKSLYMAYLFHVKFSVLKYFLYYLQIEHGLPAITFLRGWMENASSAESTLPISHRVITEIFDHGKHRDWASLSWNKNADFLFNDIEAYYKEIMNFARDRFGVDISATESETLISVQQAVMPRAGRRYPYSIETRHDFVSYIHQLRSSVSTEKLGENFKPLATFPPGKIKVNGESEFIESNEFLEAGAHANAWELPSEIRFY